MEESDETLIMSSKELEEWLNTEESKEVGQKDGGGESKGYESAITERLSPARVKRGRALRL